MESTFRPICIMIFDQTNKQVYYKYVGETYSGDTIVGNIVYDDGDYIITGCVELRYVQIRLDHILKLRESKSS